MPRALKPGDKIRSYRIVESVTSGMFACTYRGTSSAGKEVFVKQFKSPTPEIPWYHEFVAHQRDLHQHISDSPTRNFAIVLIEQFEELQSPTSQVKNYWQITEFVEQGRDLAALLRQDNVRWDQRTVWAKVIMGSIAQFHLAGIVHTDLKPDNLFLIEDATIKAGYRLKIIDLDSAIFESRRVSWSCVGTPGYLSPEHASGRLSHKSDIFSAGLILHELLGDGHPYVGLGAEYGEAIQNHRARVPILRCRMPSGNDERIVQVLHRMLDPDPAQRPDALDVLDVLNEKPPITPTSARSHTASNPRRPSAAPAEDHRSHKVQPSRTRLNLTGPKGQSVVLRVNMDISARLVRELTDEHAIWDTCVQLRVEQEEGDWYAVPNRSAPNDTILNGAPLTARTRLATNDIIAVGRVAKGIIRSPLTVEILRNDAE